jgi:outer membrane protein OmpA-like peptidoglycan-associated protein
MILLRLVRTVFFVSSVALVAPLLSINVALAATATATSVTATPSPAVAGQSVTLSATTSAPGTVTFSYDGQTVGTGVTTGSGTTLSNIQRWSYTGNSSAWRLASDSNGNIYVSTYNNMDAGGCRQVTKMLTSGGGVPCAPFESWNGDWVSVVGLAVSSTGVIYEAVYNGTAQNTIRSRTSIGATSTTFVSASALGVPSAGQGQITGMTIDASNNLYVTMRDLGEIKRITSAGVVTTYASGLGSPISSPVINPTTNVLYYINADKDIMQIPAGGGSPTLLTAASCNFETWNGSSWYGLGAQLAIDSAGFLYGAQCGGVTPLSTPNAEPITQINPSTGAMRQYLGWDQCMQASLPDGWAAGCGGNQALAFANGRLYTAGAHMGSSGVYGMNPSGYIATFTHTPTNPGVYSVGANLAPTDSGTFSASSGTGSLSVVPSAPQTPDLATASDLGNSSTDNATSDNTPRIEVPGSYSSGNTITVTATKSGSTNVTCSYVIPATGCDLGTLADGTWSITATDSHPTSGSSSASTAQSITVDTSRPAAPSAVDLAASSDTGSSNTDNNTNDNTPTMSATGGTNGDTMTISATNGTTTVSCTYVIGTATNCTLPTLTDGTWNISSTLTDPLGNVSPASSSLTVIIATTPPSRPAPDLLPSSDTGRSNSDNITDDATPEITIPGALTGDIVTVSATNGTSIFTCSYTVGSASSCSLPTLTEGTWTVSASVTDAAGNAGPSAKPLSFTIDSKSSTSSIPGSITGRLPSSSEAETKPVMKFGENSLTALIKFSPNAGSKGATSAVFTVYDKSGKIVNFITKRLKPTDTSATVTVRNNGSLASIRVHMVNSVGVSQSVRSGANVKQGKTTDDQVVTGLPKLRGELLGEVMYFKPNSTTLTPRTIQLLDQVARTINSRGGHLHVSGFARRNGIDTPKYLRNLSEQRALAVSMYLSSKGVRLWTMYQGFGAVTKEIGTPAERRVELRWVSN